MDHCSDQVCCIAVVYDMNGREASDVEPVLNAVGDIEQYIFCSSAGVYLKSDQMPHREEDATDPKSRHKVTAVRRHPSIASITPPKLGLGDSVTLSGIARTTDASKLTLKCLARLCSCLYTHTHTLIHYFDSNWILSIEAQA